LIILHLREECLGEHYEQVRRYCHRNRTGGAIPR
jgi:hypothetical protein